MLCLSHEFIDPADPLMMKFVRLFISLFKCKFVSPCVASHVCSLDSRIQSLHCNHFLSILSSLRFVIHDRCGKKKSTRIIIGAGVGHSSNTTKYNTIVHLHPRITWVMSDKGLYGNCRVFARENQCKQIVRTLFFPVRHLASLRIRRMSCQMVRVYPITTV